LRPLQLGAEELQLLHHDALALDLHRVIQPFSSLFELVNDIVGTLAFFCLHCEPGRDPLLHTLYVPIFLHFERRNRVEGGFVTQIVHIVVAIIIIIILSGLARERAALK